MPMNKRRLFVALYARGKPPTMPGKEDTYHWALIVGPKRVKTHRKGIRFDAINKPNLEGGSEWFLQERECSLGPITSMLLIRVMVGKIKNWQGLAEILRKTPIREAQPGWNCVAWIKEALSRLRTNGKVMDTSVPEWEQIRDAAMAYCQMKIDQHRFDSRGNFDITKAPTYDLIKRKEIIT